MTWPGTWESILRQAGLKTEEEAGAEVQTVVAAMALDQDVRVENEGIAGYGTIFIRRRNLSNVSPRNPVSA